MIKAICIKGVDGRLWGELRTEALRSEVSAGSLLNKILSERYKDVCPKSSEAE